MQAAWRRGVRLALALHLTPPGAEDHELFHVTGLLLENLDVEGGVSLRALPHYAPRKAWQGVVDKAVEAGRLLGERGVLDPDRHAGNFVVVPRADGGFRVVMIDFGHCRFRGECESERVWRKAQARYEVVGLWMRDMLAVQYGFELRCRRPEGQLE